MTDMKDIIPSEFYRGDEEKPYQGDDTLNVTLHYVDSPEHVEAWMETIWTKMGMDYDYHND